MLKMGFPSRANVRPNAKSLAHRCKEFTTTPSRPCLRTQWPHIVARDEGAARSSALSAGARQLRSTLRTRLPYTATPRVSTTETGPGSRSTSA
jgi:hypothetical protein